MTVSLDRKALATVLSVTLVASGVDVSYLQASPAYGAEGPEGPQTAEPAEPSAANEGTSWAPSVSEAGPLGPASGVPGTPQSSDAASSSSTVAAAAAAAAAMSAAALPDDDPAVQAASALPRAAVPVALSEPIVRVAGIMSTGDSASLVREPLQAPVVVQVANTDEGITVGWEPLKDADTFYLYRKKTGDDAWEQLATLEADVTSYTDEAVEPGTTYTYRLRARSGQDSSLSAYSAKFSLRRLLAPEGVAVRADAAGIALSWGIATGAGGYNVYRQADGTSAWTLVATTASGTTCWHTDATAKNGIRYRYCVTAVSGASEGLRSEPVDLRFVAAPKVKSLKRKSSKSYLVKWSKNSKATGYQLQYSQGSLFASKKTVKVEDPSQVQYTLKSLAANKTYFVRVRAYVKADGKTYYSAWAHSSNVSASRTVSPSRLKYKKKVLELREFSKQKMYGYDTVQGSCTDGKYGYYCLYNRKNEKCKIAKVKLSNRKVVKVSKALNVAHGNDMTYDSTRGYLVVVHSTVNAKRLTMVDPGSLKALVKVDIPITKSIPGATDAQRKAIKGMSGIAYNAKRDQYVLYTSGTHDFLVLSGELQPVRYIPVASKSGQVYQGIDATDDYIVVAVSPQSGGQSNAVVKYDWDGNWVGTVKLKKLDEVESIYHVGSKFYVSVYRSYNKTTVVKKKKTVKVNGKKKNVIVKTKKKGLARDNYVYYLPGL